jgi:hypothetical protein
MSASRRSAVWRDVFSGIGFMRAGAAHFLIELGPEDLADGHEVKVGMAKNPRPG